MDPDDRNGYEALRESAAWLTPGAGCYVFFLNALGRVLAADVTLEDTTARTTTIAVEGPRSAEALARIGAPVPQADYAFVPWGSRLVARLSSTGSPGFFVFAPAGEQADADAARIVRLEHGKPRYGEDITDRFLAQETNQSHALHFSKGCYPGQEIVERIRTRAQLHRSLMPLDIDGSTAPAPGTRLTTQGNAGARKSRRSRLRSHRMMAKAMRLESRHDNPKIRSSHCRRRGPCNRHSCARGCA